MNHAPGLGLEDEVQPGTLVLLKLLGETLHARELDLIEQRASAVEVALARVVHRRDCRWKEERVMSESEWVGNAIFKVVFIQM